MKGVLLEEVEVDSHLEEVVEADSHPRGEVEVDSHPEEERSPCYGYGGSG